jgi:hypothetical protein
MMIVMIMMTAAVMINSVQFLCLSACQQRLAYKRGAPNVYINEPRLRLELELDYKLNTR